MCLLLAATDAFSQALAYKRFNDENGFPEGYVYTVIQDPTDFLWIGTGSGIFRFNGAEFTQFTVQDSLAENFTNSSFQDPSGSIWFGHFEGGLTRLRGQRFTPVLRNTALASSITGISMDARGDLWLASQRDGIVCLDTSNFKYRVAIREHAFFFVENRFSGPETPGRCVILVANFTSGIDYLIKRGDPIRLTLSGIRRCKAAISHARRKPDRVAI